ncbi:MAG: hypothetical protein QM662_08340 [Gordonia sp. (in: high G+C Gram-positive bacteria)]
MSVTGATVAIDYPAKRRFQLVNCHSQMHTYGAPRGVGEHGIIDCGYAAACGGFDGPGKSSTPSATFP